MQAVPFAKVHALGFTFHAYKNLSPLYLNFIIATAFSSRLPPIVSKSKENL